LRSGLRGGGVERVERLLLELAYAFGTNAEVGAEAAQRSHRPVEAVAAAQDRLLAARQARDPREKARERQPAGRTLVRLLGRWVRQPLTERVAADALIAVLGSWSEHGTRSTAIRLSTCARSMPVSCASSPQDGSRPCTRT
jgi:hypothetical protein